MAFSEAFLDELRNRTSIVQVVQRRVKLTKSGREMKGCCPFHNEKTASFYVNEDKQFYHCFGCGAHGDVIRFVVEHEGLRFPEAVRQLAGECGLEVPDETPQSREREQRRAGMHDVMGQAARWFTEQLAGLAGADARRYVDGRALSPETVKRFGLGLAPAGNKLRGALASIPVEKLIECGLLGQAEDRDEIYDRFRGRLMFPIRDPRGRVVGFGGRILGDGQPKYLNSPDTPLFDKGRLLYNLDQAGPVARKSGRMLVVEGYMDTIALAQAGIEEAVAPLGTALTDHQLQLLWRIVPEPILCFDGDAAGLRAARRAAENALRLLEPGRSLRFITLPVGQDPDDIIRARGRAAFDAMIDRAEPLIERLWRFEVEGVDLRTPERRAALRERLTEHAKTIGNDGVRKAYAAEFKSRFEAMFSGRPAQQPAKKSQLGAMPLDAEAAAIVSAVLAEPHLVTSHLEQLAELETPDPQVAELLSTILFVAGGDCADLPAELRARGLDGAMSRAHACGQGYVRTIARHFDRFLGLVISRRRIQAELAAIAERLATGGDTEDWTRQRELRDEHRGVIDALYELRNNAAAAGFAVSG